jgi:hypothetical protein
MISVSARSLKSIGGTSSFGKAEAAPKVAQKNKKSFF